MAGIRNSASGMIRVYFGIRGQVHGCAATSLSILICLLRLPDGQNKNAWHQGLRKDSKSRGGTHQSMGLWKVMIISQKHWQWTFSVSKSEGDMSPLVIMIARLLPKPAIWRKQETLCCIRKISLLRCRRGAAWVICISFFGIFASHLVWMGDIGMLLKRVWEIQPNSWSWGDAGNTQHELSRKEENFSNYILCRSHDAAGFARARREAGLSLPCAVSWSNSHRLSFHAAVCYLWFLYIKGGKMDQ